MLPTRPSRPTVNACQHHFPFEGEQCHKHFTNVFDSIGLFGPVEASRDDSIRVVFQWDKLYMKTQPRRHYPRKTEQMTSRWFWSLLLFLVSSHLLCPGSRLRNEANKEGAIGNQVANRMSSGNTWDEH